MFRSQTPPRFSQGTGPWQSPLARVSLASELWQEPLSNRIMRKDTNSTSPSFESEVWTRGAANSSYGASRLALSRGSAYELLQRAVSRSSWLFYPMPLGSKLGQEKRCSLKSSAVRNNSKLKLSEWAEAAPFPAPPLTTGLVREPVQPAPSRREHQQRQ